MANLLKYGLGLNPQVASSPSTSFLTAVDPSGCLRMTVAKNPAAIDVTLAIEVTGELGDPSTRNTAGTTVEQDTLTTLQARDNTPVSAAAQGRFIRLKVTRP